VAPHIEQDLGVVLGVTAPRVLVRGIAVDSLRVQPGDVFVALPGRRAHGADFAAQAIERGAVAIVTDGAGAERCSGLAVPIVTIENPRHKVGAWCARFFGTASLPLRIVGITGTNGKTTVAHLIDAAASSAGLTTGVIGTLGIRYPGKHIAGWRTTPEAPDVHRTLVDMAQAGVQLAILEVSSHAVSERRIDGVKFDYVAFTNLSRDHLDYHGTMEAYYQAKADLFIPERARRAVIGVDDEWGARLAEHTAVAHTTWSTNDPEADWFGQASEGGVRVRTPERTAIHVSMDLPGDFNVGNATCAIAVVAELGITVESNALEGCQIPGRMETFRASDGLRVVVDYAHTADAIARVIDTCRDSDRIIVVLGAGGDRDVEKRFAMGAATKDADLVLVTDDNPRSEDPRSIRDQVVAGVKSVGVRVDDVADRRAAVRSAIEQARPGDTVLVLGKGHETGQEIAGVVHPFDDRMVVTEALADRNPE
jgi:UDP-N-acetylmuramoyl-L-alanyl-D-glutamate--2,6-diaminopimelate ligase